MVGVQAHGNMHACSWAHTDAFPQGIFHLDLDFILLFHLQTGDRSFAVQGLLGGGGELHRTTFKDGLDPEAPLGHQTDFSRKSD